MTRYILLPWLKNYVAYHKSLPSTREQYDVEMSSSDRCWKRPFLRWICLEMFIYALRLLADESINLEIQYIGLFLQKKIPPLISNNILIIFIISPCVTNLQDVPNHCSPLLLYFVALINICDFAILSTTLHKLDR